MDWKGFWERNARRYIKKGRKRRRNQKKKERGEKVLQNNSTFKWQNRPRTSKRQPEAGLLTYSHLHSFVTLVRSQSSLVLLGKKQKKWGVYQRLRLTCLCNTHTSRILVNMVHTANHDRSRERHHSASSRVTDKESVHVCTSVDYGRTTGHGLLKSQIASYVFGGIGQLLIRLVGPKAS